MTDASFPVKPINGHDLAHHTALSAAHAVSHPPRYHAPIVNHDPEDDGQISCICGFADDDGWTVACDICNRWQHQSCYYPQYDERQLPDHLQHYCVECKPRDIDTQHARRRQLEKRGPAEPLTNGVKRTASKSHKKKVKEPGATSAATTNGWPTTVDKLRHDRNSASPRDLPPPAKRPKTSHRNSESGTTANAATKGHSRKRNTSTVNHRRSVSRSPDSPIEQYSDNFLQCYQRDDWAVTSTNLHSSIAVTNALSEWLNSPDDEFRTLHGQSKGEVLMRWDGELDDIPGKAQLDICDQCDRAVQYNGISPTWKTVTVQEPVPNGAYIGELKGHLCFKKDYQEDSSNRWAELRHPEPFVFFHPKLPLVVDARNEGTELRYVRRSCFPNARLQILVTNGVDYHFCFMATQQIEPGEEVAVSWDTAEGLPHLALRSNVSDEDMEHLSSWVSTALANCGPCACHMPEGDCMMSRFDRRRVREEAAVVKNPKSKKRKNGHHISPLNTNAINSRSGSEARKFDPDDDPTDSRSVSGSAGGGSASRDMTPNTHYSTNGVQPELSEREKKKLAKEEEMFRRQEEERSGKQAKKKRSSAGSNLIHTPNANASRQCGYPAITKYTDHVPLRPPMQSTGKSATGRKSKPHKVEKPVAKVIRRPKPNYVDAVTQCDLDKEDDDRRAALKRTRRTCKSVRQFLLERCARNNQIVLSSSPPALVLSGPPVSSQGAMDVDKVEDDVLPDIKHSPRGYLDRHMSDGAKESSEPSPGVDTEMADASSEELRPASPAGTAPSTSGESTDAAKLSSPKEHPLAPPWPSTSTGTADAPASSSSKSANLHIQMPPPPSNLAGPPSAPLSAGAASLASPSIAQSPASLGPGSTLPPSVTAAVTPMKKKLSLSDYTRRKARKDDFESKADRESSPASVASGPLVTPLQAPSSLDGKIAEGSADDVDVKMDDAESVPLANSGAA
jgi:hypothetical protein